MIRRTSRLRALPCALVALGVLAVPAAATDIPVRTLRASAPPGGGTADGTSADPAFSPDGATLVFDTSATNLTGDDANGSVRDVVAIDVATGARSEPSATPGGADGPSYDAAAGGGTIAFTTDATNLVPDGGNGVPDVVARGADGSLTLVSSASDGTPADGPSGEASVSADGRLVAFASTADNLVPGDTNGASDVFVKDLDTGAIVRVSVASDGTQGNARSSQPAISADGTTVAFESGASNLVAGDTNGVSDVFVHELATRRTERVSVADDGAQQNRSVAPGFVQMPSISGDGRFVAFDSDATNLTPLDENDHTDVFVRDRRRSTTRLVSASSLNVQGNNDSFAPSLSADGRFVAFQSFASNLEPGGGPRQNVFVRDLRQRTTSVATVTATGRHAQRENVAQLLERPAIGRDGEIVAFSSTAANLTRGDDNGGEDVFVRVLTPPTGRVVSAPRHFPGTVRLAADDPAARHWICRFDTRPTFRCGTRVKVPRNVAVLYARAGGPGLRFDPHQVVVRARPLGRDTTGPSVTIAPLPRRNLTQISGTASDASGVARVDLAIAYGPKKHCHVLQPSGRFKVRPGCAATFARKAHGLTRWTFRMPRGVHGPVAVFARAVDRHGNRGKAVLRLGFIA